MPELRHYQKNFVACAAPSIGPGGDHFSMVWEATNLSLAKQKIPKLPVMKPIDLVCRMDQAHQSL